ncbi:glycosyltransferase, partial [bacterium]|nr:glycosyltransferase [bacterium]
MSGTSTHQRDILTIIDSLSHTMDTFGNAVFVVAGPLELPQIFEEKYKNRIRRYPLIQWPAFLKYYSQLTVNLAPLEVNNHFCQAKSGIKFLEAALSATPTIASPTPDFQKLIHHEKTGYIAETPQDWTYWMKRCLSEPELFVQTGQNAYSHVLKHETVEKNICLWETFLEDLGIDL